MDMKQFLTEEGEALYGFSTNYVMDMKQLLTREVL
jgi:hypothetical protein